jgi:hypothetical protein
MVRMITVMHRFSRLLLGVVATSLSAASLAACGSDISGDASLVVAKVGNMTITRAALNHWMSTNVAGDYYEHVGYRAPHGLVSDPPSYPACVSAIEAIGPPRATGGRPAQVRAQVERQCWLLYQGIKQQALGDLIHGLWAMEEDAQQGINVTEEDVAQRLARMKAERFPTEAAFKTFLADGGLTLNDERYLIKRTLLSARLEEQRVRMLHNANKGAEAVERTLIELYVKSIKTWTARTDCIPGYVVQGCRGFKASTSTLPSPAALLEQIAASRVSR